MSLTASTSTLLVSTNNITALTNNQTASIVFLTAFIITLRTSVNTLTASKSTLSFPLQSLSRSMKSSSWTQQTLSWPLKSFSCPIQTLSSLKITQLRLRGDREGGGADQARQSIPNRYINFTARLQMACIYTCPMHVQHILFSTQVRKFVSRNVAKYITFRRRKLLQRRGARGQSPKMGSF